MSRRVVLHLSFAVLLGSFVAVAVARGQVDPSYGVTAESAYVVTAWDMELSGTSPSAGTVASNFYRYVNGGSSVQMIGAVHAPQGAILTSLEVEACDGSPTDSFSATLYRVSNTANVLGNVTTTNPDQPGCTRFFLDIPDTPVDNSTYRYLVGAFTTGGTGLASIGAVRVLYHLQVSPAPGAATFGDVPVSDPAFQYVEALVASGITAGCGGGNYCPDAPLTRRQMAVFLSKALGLHWPETPVP